eukprot:37565_1
MSFAFQPEATNIINSLKQALVANESNEDNNTLTAHFKLNQKKNQTFLKLIHPYLGGGNENDSNMMNTNNNINVAPFTRQIENVMQNINSNLDMCVLLAKALTIVQTAIAAKQKKANDKDINLDLHKMKEQINLIQESNNISNMVLRDNAIFCDIVTYILDIFQTDGGWEVMKSVDFEPIDDEQELANKIKAAITTLCQNKQTPQYKDMSYKIAKLQLTSALRKLFVLLRSSTNAYVRHWLGVLHEISVDPDITNLSACQDELRKRYANDKGVSALKEANFWLGLLDNTYDLNEETKKTVIGKIEAVWAAVLSNRLSKQFQKITFNE